MIAHVAAAGEQRGRVVLHLGSGAPSPVALEAAMRVAQAFQSEIESLFVENQQLIDVAGFSFSREVSLTGRLSRQLSPEGIMREMRHVAAALQRQVAELARRAEIPHRSTVVCDEPLSAVARACTECGPWNVVALAEPLSAQNAETLSHIFATVVGTTGVVLVGPDARRVAGPVVVALEDIGHLEPMLRTAERLQAATGESDIVLFLVGRSDAETIEMEGQARLVLAADAAVTIVRASARHGTPAEVGDRLRRAGAGFILARFGGFLAPAGSNLKHLTSALECPLFLMR